MIFQNISPTTGIFIISFIIIILTFLYIGVKTLKRNRSNRTNQTFALFFFVSAIALSMNLPAPFLVEEIRILLIKITAFGVSVSVGILLVFILILRLSNQVLTDRRKWIIFSFFVVAYVGYFLLPDGVVLIDIDGILTTRYSMVLAVYFLVGTQISFILTIVLAVLVYRNFSDQTTQQRFRYFLLGLICLQVMLLSTPLINAGWLPPGSQVLLFLALPGAILIYLGVGKTV